MKKIIYFLIVASAFIFPTNKILKEVKARFFAHQVQQQSVLDKSANQSNFVGTDLLELSEDDINHFEKKFIATLKNHINKAKDLFTFAEAFTPNTKTVLLFHSLSHSSFLVFIGVFRI